MSRKMPTLLEMLKAGVHFGHQKSRWHPKMEQFIFGVRNGVHIIDLEKTQAQLEKALDYVRNLASKGQNILFVGTKRQAREAVKAAALSCEMPYLVERWIGGLLTNFEEVKRRLKKYKNLKDQFASGEIEKYTKKEQVVMKKQLEKLDKYLIGLTALERLPDAVYIADMRTEKTALAETQRTEVPTVAVCDTNTNPNQVNYPVPANDDAVNSIKMIADMMAEAVNEGRKIFEKNKLEKAKEEPAVKQKAIQEKETAPASAPARRALKKDTSI